MRAAFRLAAQYISLAQALQPGKDVYRKSLQVSFHDLLSCFRNNKTRLQKTGRRVEHGRLGVPKLGKHDCHKSL